MPWLNCLLKWALQHIDHLRRITLVGHHEWDERLHEHMPLLREWIPKLESTGIQRHRYGYTSIPIEIDRCKEWLVATVLSQFQSPITFALEILIWQKTQEGRHAVVRMISRDNKCGEIGCEEGEDDDVKVDVEVDAPWYFAEPKSMSKWRKFWNKDDGIVLI